MKRWVLAVISATALAPVANAGVFNSAASGPWGYDPRSAFTFRGQAIGVDAGPSPEELLSGRWVDLEPGRALVPNLRLQYSRSELYARPSAARDQADYLAGETLSADTTLDQYDAMFYYELDGGQWGSVDLGVNLRYLDASVATLDSGRTGREARRFSTYIPLFYAKALFDLPFAGFSAGFEGSSIQYDDNKILDYEAKIAYELNQAFGLQGGWRHQRLRLDEGNRFNTDLEAEGPFLDFYYNF